MPKSWDVENTILRGMGDTPEVDIWHDPEPDRHPHLGRIGGTFLHNPLPKAKRKDFVVFMAKTIENRIASEINRLWDAFQGCSDEAKIALDGIIKRVAFMRVKLEDLEEDIKLNGFTELFQQSEKMPAYERKRPSVDVYLNMTKNYQAAVKELKGYLPKDAPPAAVNELEAFGDVRC